MRLSLFLLCLFTSAVALSSDRRFLRTAESKKTAWTCGTKPSLTGSDGTRFNSLYGETLKAGEAPWAASLNYLSSWYPQMSLKKKEEEETFICSGTFISSRHVVTAAKCLGKIFGECGESGIPGFERVNTERWSIYYGGPCANENICKEAKRNERVWRAEVSRIFIQRDKKLCVRNEWTMSNHLAIFELKEDVEISDRVFHACLPSLEENFMKRTVTVAGFGKDEGQDITLLPMVGVLKKDEEQVVIPCDGSVFSGGDGNVMCTKSKLFSSPCPGDIGSGLVTTQGGKFDGKTTLIGVVGFQKKTCEDRIKAHRMGIDDVLKEDANKPLIHNNIHSKDNLYFICLATGLCPSEEILNGIYNYLSNGFDPDDKVIEITRTSNIYRY